jgi:hypothetical protein
MSERFLFLDLDETLISTLYANNEYHADQLLEIYTQHWKGEKYTLSDGWYVSFLREWSKDLIAYYQAILGHKNVGILSWGTVEYITYVNQLMELNVAGYNIYGREDMGANVPKLKGLNKVLVDNEDYNHHLKMGYPYTKINFLEELPANKLVTVRSFDVRYSYGDLWDTEFEDLTVQIDLAFRAGQPE